MKIQSSKHLKKKKISIVIRSIPGIKVYYLGGIVTGIVFIILANTSLNYKECKDIIPETVKQVINSFGQALIVGITMAYILDLPSLKKYFRGNIIDLLTSHDYLETLNSNQLKDLNTACIEALYVKKTNHYVDELINLNEKISELLLSPYFEYYRIKSQNQICEKYCIKKTALSFKLVNPTKESVKEKITRKVWFKSVEGFENKDVYKITKLKIKIDNENQKDLTKEVKINIRNGGQSNENSKFIAEIEEISAMDIKYNEQLIVDIEDERIISLNDPVFVKRFSKKPIKSLIVEHSIISDDYYLDGNIFGAFAGLDNNSIRVVKFEKSIQIESLNWMLPGEGFFIMRYKK